eukprot:3192813-Amphidinium_carterae.1
MEWYMLLLSHIFIDEACILKNLYKWRGGCSQTQRISNITNYAEETLPSPNSQSLDSACNLGESLPRKEGHGGPIHPGI